MQDIMKTIIEEMGEDLVHHLKRKNETAIRK
jgi:hypothetical protein